MAVLNSNTFGEKIYDRFPQKYREDDAEQNYALKRFIFTANDGGFKYVIEDINNLLNLIDPSITSTKVLKLLYEQYGFPVFNGIPEEYLRNFLPHLSEVCSYKGSLNAIDYIATSVTGVEASSEVVTHDEDNSCDVTVTLRVNSNRLKYFPNSDQFRRIMEHFIPFYCNLFIVYSYYYEEAFTIYVGHAIKHILSLIPKSVEDNFNPIEGINYYLDSEGNVLLFENGNVIME